MKCPECGSENTVKNGHTHNQKQKLVRIVVGNS